MTSHFDGHDTPTRVIIETYNMRTCIERNHSDVDAVTLVEMFVKAAIGSEFMPQSIIRAMKEVADNDRFYG